MVYQVFPHQVLKYMLCAFVLMLIPYNNSRGHVVEAQQHTRIPVLIGILPCQHIHKDTLTAQLKKDLEFSGQCTIKISPVSRFLSKKDLHSLAEKGYELGIFIDMPENSNTIEWRLYDTRTHTMIKGQRYHMRGPDPIDWAHNMADLVWPLLTDTTSSFSSKIAFCKQTSNGKKRTHALYICDIDGGRPIPLIENSTIKVAPRWNYDVKNPLLFFSEYTDRNIRLIACTLERKVKVASNFDGLNMLPTFWPHHTQVVYCASRGDGNCQLYFQKKGTFKRVTHNTGTNLSPTAGADASTIYYCSDVHNNKPGIYELNLKDNSVTPIATDGYCVCPSFSQTNNLLAYSKMINGTMQICIYDTVHKTHKQLTFNKGHKEECSWSPCGNYVVYALSNGTTQQIASLNTKTGKQTLLTRAQEVCKYPAWSPLLQKHFIVNAQG